MPTNPASTALGYPEVFNPLTTQLSSRGQIVLPKALRDAHAWGQNTTFVVRDHPEGVLLTPAPNPAAKSHSLDTLIGCVASPVRLSTKALTAVIADYNDGTTRNAKW